MIWTSHYGLVSPLKIGLRPHTAGSELLELSVVAPSGDVEANVVFAPMEDRHGKRILTVRDQNTFDPALRKKRLMTLTHLWLIHRYRADQVHYVSPTEDNQYQTQKMMSHGLFRNVHDEVGQIIVANVDGERVQELLSEDREALGRLIRKEEG
jgi:isocitrate lyase